MNKHKLSIFLILILFFIPSSSAWSEMPVTYYNNWNDSGIVSNIELDNMKPEKYPYKWNEDTTNWYFYKNNDTLTLSKNIFDEIIFYPDRISVNISTTKGTISSKSISNVTGQRYIPIPDSILKLRFAFDDVKPEVLIDNGTNQWYADPSTYHYSKVAGQVRFNFLTAPYLSLNASDKITFIFKSWVVDNAIVSGLTSVGIYSAPTTFTNNSILYLISGNGTGLFTGFNWTGTTWQSDTAIVSGLTDVGDVSTPTIFTIGSKLYLISGNSTGLFTGFNWTDLTWQSDTAIVSGLTDVGIYSAPTTFTNNSILYLITGADTGPCIGYNWSGSVWQLDTAIISGLPDIPGYENTPHVFINNSILHLISGNSTGLFTGFNWTGSTWQSDTAIVSGLTDVGFYSTPTVFHIGSILYLISGEYDGVWNGWNTSYVAPPSPPSTVTITIPANSWGMFNNWSYTTTFSGIATNESNDVAYTFYNVTSGEWESYYPGYSWNSANIINKNNSILGFFNAETTITANTVIPWDTSITEGWNMLYLMGTTNRTMTEICTNMVNCTDIYYYNSTINDYVSTGTDTIQPNQGFLAYVNQTGTWIRSTL